MNAEDLGEFGLIERLRATVERRQSPPEGLLLGIGDDAAAWTVAVGAEVATTDTMVEGIHFLPGRMPWKDIGWKAMASNLSDVAAMGCEPRFAVVTLGVPPDAPVDCLDALYEGMLDCCDSHGGAIVGGDVVASPVFFITIGLTGYSAGTLMTRTSARVGDRIAVTGTLGGSAGGLRLLLESASGSDAASASLLEAHFRPAPQVAAGRILTGAGVTAAIDVSDGLLADLGKLCKASGVAARIEADAAPIHPALWKAFPIDAVELALTGGEDYQLLFTANEAVLKKALPFLPAPPMVIGAVVAGSPGHVDVVDAQGKTAPAVAGGWDHLRRSQA